MSGIYIEQAAVDGYNNRFPFNLNKKDEFLKVTVGLYLLRERLTEKYKTKHPYKGAQSHVHCYNFIYFHINVVHWGIEKFERIKVISSARFSQN